MVAGIIVAAVGDELVIAHPTDVLPAAEVAAVVAGPALYLFAHALFRRRMAGSWSGQAGSAGPWRASPPARSAAIVAGLVLAGIVLAVARRR